MISKKCMIEQDTPERERLDMLCKLMNRDCPLKYEYAVKDVSGAEYDDSVDGLYTTIVNTTEDHEALNNKQWFEVINDEKALTAIEHAVFSSSFYRFKLLEQKRGE